jgi:omega-amidase
MSQVVISLAQMNVRKGDPRANWAKVQQMTQQAKAQGGQMVVFPELWDVGFAFKQAKEFASALNGGLFAQVGALSKQLEIYITGSMMEKRGLGIANTAPVISPDRGLLGAYRKTHLFPLNQEDVYMSAGESTLVVTPPWGATAMAICFDLRFPELFRRYALEGAKVVLMPCQWPEPRMEHYRALLRARAIENGIYIVATNRVGVDAEDENGPEMRFFGHSSIIDPWGNIVFEAGNLEGVFTAPLDLNQVAQAQKAIPVLDSRRPDLYGNY